MKATEKNAAQKRIEEDFAPVFPDDNIKCRDCVFRKPDLVIDGKVVIKNHTHGYCKVYTPKISNGKPYEVLWKHGDCKYYRKDEE